METQSALTDAYLGSKRLDESTPLDIREVVRRTVVVRASGWSTSEAADPMEMLVVPYDAHRRTPTTRDWKAHMIKRLLTPIAVSLLVVGCGSDGYDYKGAAEDLIEEEIGATASCEDPGSTAEVGTFITCTVTYSDGSTETDQFVEIVSEGRVEILVITE